ncbi:hypothetical protein EYF80_030717 [Liparis tanakae]|uniref:Uncharacterized protein n=1 Tax=Liparis tanakae TaxID=230148 RepID=A0A4Z2H1X1_9TELE|nr:hypothetical protein EYF80_030717 [Liparis tanakae]
MEELPKKERRFNHNLNFYKLVTFHLLHYTTRRDRVTCCCGEHRAAAERGSLPLPRQRASFSCELTSRKSHIWLESQRFYDT